MFKSIARKSRKDFKRSHRIQPGANVKTKLLLPLLRKKDALCTPERHGIQQTHRRIPARLQVAHNTIQLANRIRRHKVLVLQPSLNLVQLCSRKVSVVDES